MVKHKFIKSKVGRSLCIALSLVLLLSIMVSFAGCQKKKPKVDMGLVGTWEHMLGAVGGRWTFKSNGKCTHTMYSYTDAYGIEYTYDASEGVLTVYGVYNQKEVYRYLIAFSNGRKCLTLNGEIYYQIG